MAKKGNAGTTKTTPADASRIQSTQTKNGAPTSKNSFPARTQSAAAKNTNAAKGAAPQAPASPKK